MDRAACNLLRFGLMRVLVVGIGDAFSAKHFGSSCIVEGPEGMVLVDCPDSIQRALGDAARASTWPISSLTIRDIIVTHLHGDHVNGLESIGFLQWLHRRHVQAPVPRLHMGPGAAARIWDRLAPAMDQGGSARLSDYFELHVLKPEAPSRIAGLEVHTRPTGHPVPTTALRFHEPARDSNPGKCFGWSADTPWDPALVEWLSGCDVVVHETSPAPAHTPVEHLNRLSESIRRKMRLVHAPDDFDASSTPLRLLRQGEILAI